MTISMLVTTLALSACSTGSQMPSPEPAETSPVTNATEFTVTEATDSITIPNDFSNSIIYVDSHTVILVVGGSGSCPPVPENIKGTSKSVTINTKSYDGMACTMDYRTYAYKIENAGYDFSKKSFELCQYGSCQKLMVTIDKSFPKVDNT